MPTTEPTIDVLSPERTGLSAPTRLLRSEVPEVTDFLRRSDLTLSGLDSPALRLWLLRDGEGVVRGSTGYEVDASGEHALVRSVAVDDAWRGHNLGLRLGRFALGRAAAEGARHAWLFSRRSGGFWQRLGFLPADRAELARALAGTRQVRLFVESGQLEREVAWSRPLPSADGDRNGAFRRPSPTR
ncbi:GNAT family N-acetyltransferase [Streptomyces sp. NBC_01497]|uniref:GNAT family N-acetyltransferase n=1 Tax=Streptomyces sp. NBC_01497 TaxID=2903885 RepID=UPI002E321DB2|nr:GNAT family N-acetyltransferase [Streptomyces sp. NBC_01497]